MKNNPPLFTANFISGLDELSEPLYCHKKKTALTSYIGIPFRSKRNRK
jgi:hypothetical protein